MGGGSLRVNAKLVVSDVHIGDSIAVNGICLTVTSFDKNGFTADVMPVSWELAVQLIWKER